MRLDDMQHSVAGAKEPYINTHIYLFKDGYLWREIDVNKQGNLYEVDLPHFKTSTYRYATAELPQGILLPIEDADGKHTFHVAVSHLRLSWRTLHLLGGLDPKDTRFGLDQRMRYAPDKALIKKRLQLIDVHGLVSQGNVFSELDVSETEDELLRGVHTNEPPDTNVYWIIDRDKINHSRETKKAKANLYWEGWAVILMELCYEYYQ